MAIDKTTTERTNGNGTDDSEGGALVGVMNSAQGAAQAAQGAAIATADAVRSAAGTAAERLPAAVNTAQEVASGTATTLDELPDHALIIGTSFSLGLGVGMFLTGTNRLLVLLALVPAAAMAATLVGREGGLENAVDVATGG